MGYLYDIGRYKSRFKSKLAHSDDIKECLLGKDYDEEMVDDLLDGHIYSYLYVPDTQTETKSYICFDIRVPRVPSDYIKDMELIIYVFAHKDKMKYTKVGYIGNRCDALADMIDTAIANAPATDFGIGSLRLSSIDIYQVGTEYYGRVMKYTCSEFYKK